MSIAQGTTDIDWFLIMKILGFVTAIAVCLLISNYLYNTYLPGSGYPY